MGDVDDDVRDVLNTLKARLMRSLGNRAFRLVLFGSRARGDYDKDSDIDVAVIVDGLSSDLKNRILDQVTDLGLDRLRPLSSLVLSQAAFDGLKSRERRIALDIEEEGILV